MMHDFLFLTHLIIHFLAFIRSFSLVSIACAILEAEVLMLCGPFDLSNMFGDALLFLICFNESHLKKNSLDPQFPI